MYIIHRRHRKGFDPYAYTDESVTVLTEDRIRVRTTPKIYLPNMGIEGALHLIEEALANSIDELTSPNSVGSEIIVTYNEKEKKFSIQDNGRGFPLNKLHDMCEVLNSSAKMGSGKRAYSSSGGVHGMGLKLINFFTKYMHIRTEREGKKLEVHYDDGIRKSSDLSKSKDHGTYIEWQYDNRFFSSTNITCDDIIQMIKLKSYVIQGVNIIFNGIKKDGKEILREFKGTGLKEYIKQFNISTPIVEAKGVFGGSSVEFMFGYDADSVDSYNVAAYTNNIYNKLGGSHVDGLLEGIVYSIRGYMYNKYLSEKEKKDLKIRAEDCRVGLIGIISIYTENPSFRGGQHKATLDMNDIKNLAFRTVRSAIAKLDSSKLNRICMVIKSNARARMSAENSRVKSKKDITNAFSSDKIDEYIPISKRSTNKDTELFLVEGLSARDGIRKVAEKDYQALLAVRGKIENVFDLPSDEALRKSKFLGDLYEIFGCGIGKTFDISKFPFQRIILATDADTDGNEIACQMAMMFVRFFPQVVLSGRLYRLVPPLYEVRQGGESVFVPSSREFLTMTQNNFAKAHAIYLNGKELNKNDILSILLNNERYVESIERLANQYAISPVLAEFIIANKDIGFDNTKIDLWNKRLRKLFRFLHSERGDNGILISGMVGTEYNLFEYMPEFDQDSGMVEVSDDIYGYSIDNKENMSLYQVLKEFEKYQPKIEARFKGLGEMDADDIDRTMMKRSVRHSIRLTMADIQDTYDRMATMHSRKKNYSDRRKKFMSNFEFDIMDIDT